MRFSFILCILFIFPVQIPAGEVLKFEIQESFKGKVVSVQDGDTIGVMMQGKEVRVRLQHIDAPEKKQPFGTKAKGFLSDLVFGKIVEVSWKSKDRYGRFLAEIILPDGRNVNKEIVKAGYAWHFKKYSRICLTIAWKNKPGQLSQDFEDAHPIPPWEWRKTKK